MTEIFLYSDICENHRVGNTFSPLLRCISLSGEKDDQIVRIYNDPIYFPVKNKYIETIQIELRSSSGSKVVFATGKTIVTLSFREK